MAPRSRVLVRVSIFSLSVIFLFVLFSADEFINLKPLASISLSSKIQKQNIPKEILQSLSLTEEQCLKNFPELIYEIELAVARGPFELKRAADDYQGLVQGRIQDGKLYIISSGGQMSQNMRRYRDAVLYQLHRAIITSSFPLPNTIFALCINDSPRADSWNFARPIDPSSNRNNWPMPHFSYWSWPLPFVGPLDEVLSKIETTEKEISWEQKIDKVVWRGTSSFNPIGNPGLRGKLVQVAGGKNWADVETLVWQDSGKAAENAIAVEDFCRYRYIIYTEGVTYSGRLPYHQACASVVLTPPPGFLQHTSHLMRPLFSSSLDYPSSITGSVSATAYLTWPRSYPPSEANIIFVAPDWSDLEPTVKYLRKHPDIAETIARNQRDLMVRAGYLSPAAETCYWRALIEGWAAVARAENETEWGRGMRFETWSLLERTP